MAQNEALVLDGLALNDGTTFTLEAADLTPPAEAEEFIKGADSDGALLARFPTFENRVITASLRIEPQATMDLALAKVGLIVDKLQEAKRNMNGVALTWVPADATLPAITFRCLSGQITGLPVDVASGWFVKAPLIQIKLTCLPFGEGAEVTSYVNEITNPSFESATTPWTSGLLHTNAATSLTVSAANGAQVGTNAALVNCTTTANSGIEQAITGGFPPGTYTFAFYARSVTGTLACESVLTGSGGGGGTQVAALTTTWTRFTHTVTLTVQATTLNVAVRTTATSGNDFVLDACLLVKASTAPTYFDGATGSGYVWLGTAHASKSAGPNAVASTDPIVTLELSGVSGDVPALAKVIATDAATQSRRYVALGVESRWYPTSSPPSLIVDSTSMVTSGFAGATATQSGAYSGASNNVIQATLRTQPQAVCGLGNLSHVGDFRPQLRFYASAVTMGVRLTYQSLDGPFRSLSYQIPVGVGWNHVDLGSIKVPSSTLGTQRWTGRIDAYSTATGGETIGVDAMWLMPAEQFQRARGVYSYQAGAIVGYDEFTGTTSGGNLNARVAPAGGTWATSGSTTDLQFADLPTGLETVTRATTSDASRRVAVLGSVLAPDNEVGIDVYVSVKIAHEMSVLARWVDASNYLTAQWSRIAGVDSFRLMAVVASSGVAAQSIAVSPVAAAWYTLKVVVYASGVAIGMMLDSAGQVMASARIWHSSLATGGALDDGKAGFHDYNSSASAVTRYYDNFYIATPTAEPIVCYSGQSIQFASDGTLREDSTGTYAGPPPDSGIGPRIFIPPAGGPARKTRLAMIARRNDVGVTTDDNIADNTVLQASWTPRYIAVPRA